MDALKVVTHNIPWFLRDPAVSIIGQGCYTTLIYNLDLADAHCLRYSLSKVLGLGIVLGGSIVKLPQIIKVFRSKSARGLSLSSYLLDTTSTAITVAYNARQKFPFSTYGEMVFLLGQNAILIVLIVLYSHHSTRLLLPLALVAALSGYFLLTVPSKTLSLLLSLSIPISLSSKVPQILSNYSLGSTGQLSAFLVINSFAGCLARVFTTMTETGDRVLWWGFVLAAALNGVIGAQMIAYWDRKEPVRSSAKVEEEAVGQYQGGDEKVEIVSGTDSAAEKVKKTIQAKVAAPSSRPASPASARKYVRKLD